MKFIFILTLFMCTTALAGVGDIDQREYVNWSTPPYNQIVYFRPSEYSTCTGQYVAPDIILTARHCITDQREHDNYAQIGKTYDIQLHDGRTTTVVLEKYGHNFNNDWALLRIPDQSFFSASYFNVHTQTEYLPVINAGFGYMRILSDTEIQRIKQIFTTVIGNQNRFINFDDALSQAEQEIKNQGIPNLYDWDDSIPGYRLKADKTCQLVKHQNKDKTISTTCDNWGGNSGGAYFSGNTLYGICSYGADSWVDEYNTDHAVSPKLYYAQLQSMKSSSPIPVNNTETNAPKPELPQGNNEQTLNLAAQHLQTQLANIQNMTNAEFLSFLGQTTEYSVLKENYERARARETSQANRILGGLAIGATGIGGMMLASGMAEKSADEAAETAMRAYLATFTCNYGDGKNVRGGEQNVELPGGNDLMKLKSEYVALAHDLKQRKEQLGLPPGIESETIHYSATAGLYDDIATGKTSGAYTSLSRALSDETSADATAWAQQKSDTEKKIKTGSIVGGVGAAGGLIGDLIINRETTKPDDE